MITSAISIPSILLFTPERLLRTFLSDCLHLFSPKMIIKDNKVTRVTVQRSRAFKFMSYDATTTALYSTVLSTKFLFTWFYLIVTDLLNLLDETEFKCIFKKIIKVGYHIILPLVPNGHQRR